MENKILIAYFSHKGENYISGNIIDLKIGNTEIFARRLSDLITADLFKIETIVSYPHEYNETTAVAKKELLNNERPKLKTEISNISIYEVIFLGFPNWWGTMPMAVWTFLESYDFTNKIIIPFCTHEGSGLGESMKHIKKLLPNSIIKDGVAIVGSNVNKADRELQKLVNSINIY